MFSSDLIAENERNHKVPHQWWVYKSLGFGAGAEFINEIDVPRGATSNFYPNPDKKSETRNESCQI
jgi:hypothetical protein